MLEVVLVRTIQARARVAEFADSLRVDEEALVAIAALREEFALFFGVDVLAGGVRLVALRPVLASDLYLLWFSFLLIRLTCVLARHFRCLLWLVNRSKSFQSLLLQDFGLLGAHLRLDEDFTLPKRDTLLMLQVLGLKLLTVRAPMHCSLMLAFASGRHASIPAASSSTLTM